MKLDKVEGRAKLKARRDPYWQRLSEGRYVGFRKMAPGSEGTWLARFYNGERNQQKPLGSFDTLDAGARYDRAKKAAEDWFGHLDKGGSTAPGTVRSACEAYVDHLRAESSEAAADDADGRFRRLIYSDAVARVDLSKLAAHHIDAWRKRVIGLGSRASFNRNATSFRAALNRAKELGKVPTDQAWAKWLKPIKDVVAPRRGVLTRPERRSLVEAASAEARPFLKALALHPMRPGELASFQVKDLDAKAGLLRVPEGKTKAREVPLSAEALAHFKACARGKLPEAWLVSRLDGSQWKKAAWRNEVKAAAKAAKLPAATVALTLRHSTITDLVVVEKLDLFTVAKLSGTSVAMIEKTYGHLRSDLARTALQGLSLGAA